MINEIGLEIFLSRKDVDFFPLRKFFLMPYPAVRFSGHLKLMPPSPHRAARVTAVQGFLHIREAYSVF